MSKEPFKARPLRLAKKVRVVELSAVALANASEQIRQNTRGAHRDVDPDFTHQLRVGARRARVVVRLFQAPIGKPCARRLERDLRWIFRVAGHLRDYDVVLRETLAPLLDDELEDGAPGLLWLDKELTRQRQQAARTLKRALASRRYLQMLRTLGKVVDALEHHDEPGRRARKWSRKQLDKRLAEVLALRSAALGDDESERHELRKRLKKLRYAAELVGSIWPKKRVKGYLHEMEALQDTLGALNDAATGRHLLGLAAAAAPGDTAAALERCEQLLQDRLKAEATRFQPAFLAFEQATPFWR